MIGTTENTPRMEKNEVRIVQASVIVLLSLCGTIATGLRVNGKCCRDFAGTP